MKKTTFKNLVMAAVMSCLTIGAKAQAFTEGFDDITTLVPGGWFMQNNSVPVGSTNWFQGNATVFAAQSGPATSYIGANFNNTTGTNTISNWLLTPNRTFKNGDVISFWTRYSGDIYPDRLQVRFSANGTSTNVGTGSAAVGDFTTLMLDINPTLVASGYPAVWTQYTLTISGLPAPTSGRVAFRYFVPNGGPTGANSDYIGIDNVVYTPYVCPLLTVNPTSIPAGTAGVSYSQTLTQTGALGTPSYAVTAGSLPAGLTLSLAGVLSGTPTVIGTFNFTVTVADASGCFGSQAYTLVIGCPTFVFTLGSFANGTAGVAYSQTAGTTGGVGGTTYAITAGALPPGLTMSSGGAVTGTPSTTGTYNFTITATDANGCTGSAAYSITIGCPTFVFTLGSFANGTAGVAYSQTAGTTGGVGGTTYAITAGALPPGLTMSSGGAVTGTPTATGTYNFTITATDANACTGSSAYSITIVCPTGGASLTVSPAAVCSNAGVVTITGGSPAGGTYSGTGVSGTTFDPSAGTQVITYSLVDAFACPQSATNTITVNAAPALTASSTAAGNMVCTGGNVTLTGSGADTYVWDNSVVDGVSFTPAGTNVYTVVGTTTSTGCTNTASITITVNPNPVVDLTFATSTVCIYASPFTLTGESPAGGAFSGTGVTGSTFDPAAAGAGTFAISYVYTDANGCVGMDTDNMTVDLCTGIASADAAQNLNVFPNPSNGTFTLIYDQITAGNLSIRITDVQGKVLVAESMSNFSGQYKNVFDMSSFDNGIYMIEVTGSENQAHKKIVLQ